MGKSVVILGGGIAGLTAAHELIDRGFSVDVFDRSSLAGGKARSLEVLDAQQPRPSPWDGRKRPATESSVRSWLPGEHGFRFFPGFYKHVIDTMRRIPFGDCTVADNLVATSQVHIARFGQAPVFYPARFPESPGELRTAVTFVVGLLAGQMDIPPNETAFFAERVFQIVSSCQERRLAEYEKIDWWQFVQADAHSLGYQKFFANGFTRSLVAAKAERASTKTIGDIFVQMILSALTPFDTADRVLNGPTSEVWLSPWYRHLIARGVRYHFDSEVVSLDCRGQSIQAAVVSCNGRPTRITGDYFVAALPVERLVPLVTPAIVAADARFDGLAELSENLEWMNGVQFYLTEDRPLVHGHSIYMDTPWALTSVSQAQFWPDYPPQTFANGRIGGILSVCVSDWDVEGLNGKKAEDCAREEIADEVWRQLKKSLNVGGTEVLSDDILYGSNLDPDIRTNRATSRLTNAEPLLVNYVDTWRLRPEATTGIANLFLASDYVRTYTDIATMEAANEAARRAVNGILAAESTPADPCPLWNLHEPEALAPLRLYDRERFRRGLPWDSRVSIVGDRVTALIGSKQVGELLSSTTIEPTAGAGVPLDEAAAPDSLPIHLLPI